MSLYLCKKRIKNILSASFAILIFFHKLPSVYQPVDQNCYIIIRVSLHNVERCQSIGCSLGSIQMELNVVTYKYPL